MATVEEGGGATVAGGLGLRLGWVGAVVGVGRVGEVGGAVGCAVPQAVGLGMLVERVSAWEVTNVLCGETG